MDPSKTATDVFEEWGRDARADRMASHHWPLVRQAFDLIPDMPGNYLEIGVGNGYGIRHMATHQFSGARCFGVDLAASMVALSRRNTGHLSNVFIEQGNFLEWSAPAGESFALIFSMEVFYYLPDIQTGIDHARSLLEPGGQLWVLVNYYTENTVSHDWPQRLRTPMRMWSMQDYRDGFHRAGFSGVKQAQIHDPRPEAIVDGPALCTMGIRAP